MIILLVALLSKWIKQDFLKKKNISGIWFELDVGSSSSFSLKTNLFLELDGTPEQNPKTIDEAIQQLRQKQLSKEAHCILHQCYGKNFRLFSVGFMFGSSLGCGLNLHRQ